MSLHPEAKRLVWDKYRNPNCTLCDLYKEAQTVCLMGDGPVINTKIMLVGEAPGWREDEISMPFQGAAGKKLTQLLEGAGIARSEVYITNSVRCRPPDNRTPSRSEIKACSVYMDAEIAAVNPEIIVPLGNPALQTILGTSGITKKRGAVTERNGRRVLPTFHPAAALRNPALEPEILSDFHALKRLEQGDEKKPITKVWLIKNSKALGKFLDRLAPVDTPIAYDVETSAVNRREDGALQPWAPDGVLETVAFSWEPGVAYTVALEHEESNWDISIKLVYQALAVALGGKKLIGHNVKFDAQWLASRGIKTESWFDTLLAAHLLDENRKNGLKSLARTYLGADLYEDKVNFREGTPLPILATYNGKDADYTLRLYHIFREELRAKPKLARLFKLLTMPACNALTDIEMRGFPVDLGRLKKRNQKLLDRIARTERQLLKFVPQELLVPRPNFRSPLFLGRWLFGSLNLPILEVGAKSGRPSTAESVLLQLRHKHPAVSLLMELRKWQKFESTYTRNWIRRVKIAGKPRLYPSYNIAGTVTGRLSSNMQQVPRDTLIRGIIGAERGWKLIEADFSQVELRIAAMFSRDKTLSAAFIRGDDPHMETAVSILNRKPEDISKEERKLAKSVNFGFLYGMGWRKFITYADEKYETKVTEVEAKKYRDAFFGRYRGLPLWHNRQRRLVGNLGFVSSPLGRVRHLPQISSDDEGVVAEAERQAINSPVQGFASDLTVFAMVLLERELDTSVARVLGNLHDAIILEAREDVAEQVGEQVKRVMENLPLKRYFGFVPTVPIQSDMKVSDHWGE